MKSPFWKKPGCHSIPCATLLPALCPFQESSYSGPVPLENFPGNDREVIISRTAKRNTWDRKSQAQQGPASESLLRTILKGLKGTRTAGFWERTLKGKLWLKSLGSFACSEGSAVSLLKRLEPSQSLLHQS